MIRLWVDEILDRGAMVILLAAAAIVYIAVPIVLWLHNFFTRNRRPW